MQPIIFQSKFISINTLWVFLSIAIIVFARLLISSTIKNGLKIQFLSDNFLPIILWFIIGARLTFVVNNFTGFFYEFSLSNILQIFFIWDKGLSFMGGLLFAGIFFYRLCKKNDQDFFRWLDAILPPLIITASIMHVGAFFEGANYGRESGLPWAVNFESPTIKYTVPIHPTQVYALIYSVAIYYILLFLEKNKELQEKIEKIEKRGFVGIFGIAIYSLMAILEQFFRGDDTITIYGIRSQFFTWSLILILSSIFFYKRYNSLIKEYKTKLRKKWKK